MEHVCVYVAMKGVGRGWGWNPSMTWTGVSTTTPTKCHRIRSPFGHFYIIVTRVIGMFMVMITVAQIVLPYLSNEYCPAALAPWALLYKLQYYRSKVQYMNKHLKCVLLDMLTSDSITGVIKGPTAMYVHPRNGHFYQSMKVSSYTVYCQWVTHSSVWNYVCIYSA